MNEQKGLTVDEVKMLVGAWVIRAETLEKEILKRDAYIDQLRAELSEARKANEKEL